MSDEYKDFQPKDAPMEENTMDQSMAPKPPMVNTKLLDSALSQVSRKGRKILKAIEGYKFTVEQTIRKVQNDPQLVDVITSKKKSLEHAAQDLYTIVFDIENIDISSAYDQDPMGGDPTHNKPHGNQSPQEIQNGTENKEASFKVKRLMKKSVLK